MRGTQLRTVLLAVCLGCVLTYMAFGSHVWSREAEESSSLRWQHIWKLKGVKIGDGELLHHANGFNAISLKEWDTLIATIITSGGAKRIQAGESVIDFGCGAGAFLRSLSLITADLHLYGIDYSAPLVALARQHVANSTAGHFWRGDVRDVGFIPEEEFDIAVSFSVFQYLSTFSDVLDAWSEMARVTKVKGSVIVADVSDKSLESDYLAHLRGNSEYEKKKLANRKSDAKTPPHFFIPKSLFLENAANFGLRVDAILDERKMETNLSFYEPSAYRYTVYATKIKSLDASGYLETSGK